MEYSLHHLIRLGHPEIHIGLSNLNIDVRILTHCNCVAVNSLSYSLRNIKQDEIGKPWLIKQETESE